MNLSFSFIISGESELKICHSSDERVVPSLQIVARLDICACRPLASVVASQTAMVNRLSHGVGLVDWLSGDEQLKFSARKE